MVGSNATTLLLSMLGTARSRCVSGFGRSFIHHTPLRYKEVYADDDDTDDDDDDWVKKTLIHRKVPNARRRSCVRSCAYPFWRVVFLALLATFLSPGVVLPKCQSGAGCCSVVWVCGSTFSTYLHTYNTARCALEREKENVRAMSDHLSSSRTPTARASECRWVANGFASRGCTHRMPFAPRLVPSLPLYRPFTVRALVSLTVTAVCVCVRVSIARPEAEILCLRVRACTCALVCEAAYHHLCIRD